MSDLSNLEIKADDAEVDKSKTVSVNSQKLNGVMSKEVVKSKKFK